MDAPSATTQTHPAPAAYTTAPPANSTLPPDNYATTPPPTHSYSPDDHAWSHKTMPPTATHHAHSSGKTSAPHQDLAFSPPQHQLLTRTRNGDHREGNRNHVA